MSVDKELNLAERVKGDRGPIYAVVLELNGGESVGVDIQLGK